MKNRYKKFFKEDEVLDDLAEKSVNDLKVEDVIFILQKFHKEHILGLLQKYFLGEFWGIKLYFVNGNYVNLNYDMSFVTGSNYMVTDYIPKGEA